MLPVEDVQSYPRPPLCEPVPHEVVARFAGTEIYRGTDALRVCETHHAPTYYLPIDALPAGLLTPVPGRSFCEWKGVAAYFDLTWSGQSAARAAWTYPQLSARFAQLKDHVAIYAHALDRASVGGLVVTPQPGDFYGGWVTENLTGIVKGGPGTEGW